MADETVTPPEALASASDRALLDELVRRGVLTPEGHCATAAAAHADGDYSYYDCSDMGRACPTPRLVSQYGVLD